MSSLTIGTLFVLDLARWLNPYDLDILHSWKCTYIRLDVPKYQKGTYGHISCKRDGEKVSHNQVIVVGEDSNSAENGFQTNDKPLICIDVGQLVSGHKKLVLHVTIPNSHCYYKILATSSSSAAIFLFSLEAQ